MSSQFVKRLLFDLSRRVLPKVKTVILAFSNWLPSLTFKSKQLRLHLHRKRHDLCRHRLDRFVFRFIEDCRGIEHRYHEIAPFAESTSWNAVQFVGSIQTLTAFQFNLNHIWQSKRLIAPNKRPTAPQCQLIWMQISKRIELIMASRSI